MKAVFLFFLSVFFINISHAQEIKPTGEVGTSSPIVIKISHNQNANSIKGKTALRFKFMLEGKLGTKVKVEVSENSKDYSVEQELDNIQEGKINIGFPSTYLIEKKYDYKTLQIFDIPFLLLSTNDFFYLINNESGDKIINDLNKKSKDLEFFTFISEGPKFLASNVGLKSASDFKNKNMEISSSLIESDFWKGLELKKFGQISFSNVLFEQSIINNNILELNLEEYLKNNLDRNSKFKTLTDMNYGYSSSALVANKEWFKNLPEEVKNAIIEISQDALLYNLEEIDKIIPINKATLVNRGVSIYTATPIEKEFLKESSKKIHENFKNNIDQDLLTKAYEALKGKNKNE